MYRLSKLNMHKNSRFRFAGKLLSVFFIVVTVIVSGIVLQYHFISFISKSKIIDVPAMELSEYSVLVLGAGHYKPEQWTNYTLINRMDAVNKLYLQNPEIKIIASGKKKNDDDDEAGDMKKMLVERGIPQESIVVDTLGFRTWASVKNGRAIAGNKKLIIVSQREQTERALFIACCLNVKAMGFIADPPPYHYMHLTWREYFARVKSLIDCILYKTGITDPAYG